MEPEIKCLKLWKILKIPPESGEDVGHQQFISQPSPLLGVCCVERVRDQQAEEDAINTCFRKNSNTKCPRLKCA